jgi:hypothetical protein
MASMRAFAYIYIYIWIVQYECRLIFLSGKKASFIFACIVVETSFIKLNIIRSASDNQQKYITHIQDIQSLSSSFVVSFFLLLLHTPIFEYILLLHTRLIALSYLLQQYNSLHIYAYKDIYA